MALPWARVERAFSALVRWHCGLFGRTSEFREAFDGGDLGAFRLQDGDEAGVNEFSVHDDGTGAALAFAAALLGAGEAKVLAEDVEQALHGRGGYGCWLSIDRQGDGCHAETSEASVVVSRSVLGSRSSEPESGVRVMRSKMSSGRRGISVKEMPVACSMALRMAGAGPSMGSSPMPLAPPGPWMQGVSSK